MNNKQIEFSIKKKQQKTTVRVKTLHFDLMRFYFSSSSLYLMLGEHKHMFVYVLATIDITFSYPTCISNANIK